MWIAWFLVTFSIIGFLLNCTGSQTSNEILKSGTTVPVKNARESARIYEKTMESTQLLNINRIHQSTLKCKAKIHVVVTLETDKTFWIASTITFCKIGDRKGNGKHVKGKSGHFVNCETDTDRFKLTDSQDENKLKDTILELLMTKWGDFGIHCAQIFCKFLDSETEVSQEPVKHEDFFK